MLCCHLLHRRVQRRNTSRDVANPVVPGFAFEDVAPVEVCLGQNADELDQINLARTDDDLFSPLAFDRRSVGVFHMNLLYVRHKPA